MEILEGQRVCCGCGQCKSVTLFAKTERKCKKCRSDDRQQLKQAKRAAAPQPPKKVPTFDAAVPMREWKRPADAPRLQLFGLVGVEMAA